MKIEQKQFPNFGYSIASLPDNVLNVVKKEVIKFKDNIDAEEKIKKKLAGHLEYQFYLRDSVELLTPIIFEMAAEYVLKWNYDSEILKNNPKLKVISFKLDPMWINFQQKYEYNPLHDHSGLFSFVIWVNIPYDLEKEMSVPGVHASNSPLATSFNFTYTNVFGEIISLPFYAEKKYEGTILFFPSKLKHLVYPFLTSDDFRVTISGNIQLNNDS